jgi:hypothetical protein
LAFDKFVVKLNGRLAVDFVIGAIVFTIYMSLDLTVVVTCLPGCVKRPASDVRPCQQAAADDLRASTSLVI